MGCKLFACSCQLVGLDPIWSRMWGLFEQHDSQFWGGSGSLAPVPRQAILALYRAWLEKPFSLQWLSPPGVVNNIPEAASSTGCLAQFSWEPNVSDGCGIASVCNSGPRTTHTHTHPHTSFSRSCLFCLLNDMEWSMTRGHIHNPAQIYLTVPLSCCSCTHNVLHMLNYSSVSWTHDILSHFQIF